MLAGLSEKQNDRIHEMPYCGCWVWAGATARKGYGNVVLSGKSWRLHRYAWTSVHGPIPKGMLVCHKCDNPPCCNPDHLFLGTNQDNVTDMIAKGRQSSKAGDCNPRATVNWEQVLEIRALWPRFTIVEIAARFDMPRSTVQGITSNTTWKVDTE